MEENKSLLNKFGQQLKSNDAEVQMMKRLATDIKKCKEAVRSIPSEKAWESMLTLLSEETIMFMSNPDFVNQDSRSQIQSEAIGYLTMQAASLVHGGKGRNLANELSDQEIQKYSAGCQYVYYCCVMENLRRNELVEEFIPSPDVLNAKPDEEEIRLTQKGRDLAWETGMEKSSYSEENCKNG